MLKFSLFYAYKNKRPIGHITHLKKQFQSINTFWQSYDYTIMLIKREGYLLLENWFWSKLKFNPLHSRMLCDKFGLNRRRRFQNSFNVFSLFHYYFPFWKWQGPSYEKKFHSPKNALCQVGWNWPIVSGEDDFQTSFMKYYKIIIISPLKGCGPSLEQTWIAFIHGCFVPSLAEIISVFLETKIKICEEFTDRGAEYGRQTIRWAKT